MQSWKWFQWFAAKEFNLYTDYGNISCQKTAVEGYETLQLIVLTKLPNKYAQVKFKDELALLM